MKRGEPPAGPTRNNLPPARYYRWRDPARAKTAQALATRVAAVPVCDCDPRPVIDWQADGWCCLDCATVAHLEWHREAGDGAPC